MTEQFETRNSSNRLKKLILTSAQYAETPFAHDEGERKYVYELNVGKKKLCYFGSDHSNDPDDTLFVDIKNTFERVNPDLVMIEGWGSINNQKERAIDRFGKISEGEAKEKGEPHFVLKLAIEAGVDFESPEPPLKAEVTYLIEQGFSHKDIFFYYLYRQVHQYQREHGQKLSVEDCLCDLKLEQSQFMQASGLDEVEVDNYFSRFMSELDINDTQKYGDLADPIPWPEKEQTVYNEISSGSSQFRDEYIYERIVSCLDTHDSVFVVYGSAHAVKLEPALKALFAEFDDK
jgi:hypothetical protein